MLSARRSGSASFFHPVSSALRPDIEVLAIQYPGRQDRRGETPMTDIGELADRVFEALRPQLVREPRPAFFGHSMGATVAFEVAVRMRREGLAPTVLIPSGRRAPSERRSEDVHLRDDAGLVAEIRKLSGTDTRLLDDEEMLSAILPAVRADYRAIERYVGAADAVVDCPVEVFVGDTDEQVTLQEADAWRRRHHRRLRRPCLPGRPLLPHRSRRRDDRAARRHGTGVRLTGAAGLRYWLRRVGAVSRSPP
ncbi:alpha/beta fold hydrolase [Streptomyces sp. UP1A-1]|nr:alpha/beta fold hydrolase [Streptomyces sp. UP1A-1]